jgi:hypothetical protein
MAERNRPTKPLHLTADAVGEGQRRSASGDVVYHDTKRKLTLSGSWNAPHIDAELYIADVIREAERLLKEVTEGEVTQEEVIEEMTGSEENLHYAIGLDEWEPRNRSREERANQRIFDPDLYEGVLRDQSWETGIPFENLAERKHLLDQARDALLRGDPEDTLSALTEFNGSFYEKNAIPGLEEAENWHALLASSKASRAADDASEANRLIKVAIQDLCEKLCSLIAKDSQALRLVEWRDLERIVAACLAAIGFDVELTPPAKDDGRDVIARCLVRGFEHTYYIEVKHWRSGKRVGASTIVDFLEVNASDRTDGGLLLSSSGFTSETLAHLSELEHRPLRLGGKSKIVWFCQQFVRRELELWRPTRPLPELLFERTMKP